MIGLNRSKYLSIMIVLAMLFTIVAPGVAWAEGETLAHNVAGNAKTFTPVVEGYGAGTQEAALTVTVTATGAHTNVAAALSGANAGSFTLTDEAIGGLTDTTGTFTVRANDGLAAGTYNATVTITSDEFAGGVTFTVTQVVNTAPTYALTLTGENISSVPVAGNLTANTSVTVTVAPAAGKQVATFTVGGVNQKAALVSNQYTFNMPAAATEVVVTYENISGHAANITTTNVIIVGNYAFELNDASYTLNNYLTAAQTAWVNSATGNYEIYYFANSKWYDLVKAETLGLVQAAEVDPSNINGTGLYTHMNMTAL